VDVDATVGPLPCSRNAGNGPFRASAALAPGKRDAVSSVLAGDSLNRSAVSVALAECVLVVAVEPALGIEPRTC
jgi:hypothetical protein